MPTYTFEFEDGERFDEFHPFSTVPESVVRGGRKAKRVFASSGNFQLRGKGWASKPERDAMNLKRGPQ